MSTVVVFRVHALMLLLEARFGSSTLQNYDAILRDAKFGSQSSATIRLVLLALFALPLGLSISYKRYVGGRTTVLCTTDKTILFAPSAPPDLFTSTISLVANATSALYAGRLGVPLEELPFNTSFGYNMHVINQTVTAMLDIPIVSNTSVLKSLLKPGTILTISAPVNATFARLHSTPSSPERQQPNYWDGIAQRLGSDNIISQPTGQGTWLGMWSGWVDKSLIFMSYWNQSKNEVFQDKAVGFNIYRGTSYGTWQISPDSFVLHEASDFQTDFSPDMQHPEVTGPASCDAAAAPNSPQKIMFCSWTMFAGDYLRIVTSSLVGGSRLVGPMGTSISTSTLVANIAVAGWASTVGIIGNSGQVAPVYQYLLQTPRYLLSASYPTLHRHVGLVATLAVQPLLLLLVIAIRILFRSVPLSEEFGLITLLAGVRRENLELLRGSSYTGKVEEKVFVEIIVRHGGRRRTDRSPRSRQENGPVVEYVLSRENEIGTRSKRSGRFPEQ